MIRFDLDHQLFFFHLLVQKFILVLSIFTQNVTPEHLYIFQINQVANVGCAGVYSQLLVDAFFFFTRLQLKVSFQMSLKGAIYPWLCEATASDLLQYKNNHLGQIPIT